ESEFQGLYSENIGAETTFRTMREITRLAEELPRYFIVEKKSYYLGSLPVIVIPSSNFEAIKIRIDKIAAILGQAVHLMPMADLFKHTMIIDVGRIEENVAGAVEINKKNRNMKLDVQDRMDDLFILNAIFEEDAHVTMKAEAKSLAQKNHDSRLNIPGVMHQ